MLTITGLPDDENTGGHVRVATRSPKNRQIGQRRRKQIQGGTAEPSEPAETDMTAHLRQKFIMFFLSASAHEWNARREKDCDIFALDETRMRRSLR